MGNENGRGGAGPGGNPQPEPHERWTVCTMYPSMIGACARLASGTAGQC